MAYAGTWAQQYLECENCEERPSKVPLQSKFCPSLWNM